MNRSLFGRLRRKEYWVEETKMEKQEASKENDTGLLDKEEPWVHVR